MPEPIYLDSETCGFVGPMVLLQYAKGLAMPTLHNVWLEPIPHTLDVIQEIVNNPGGVVGFNLSFDWFHLVKIYNILHRLKYVGGYEGKPIGVMNEIWQAEPYCKGLSLRPHSCLDLMLHARKGEFQTTMGRKDIIIKKVPPSFAPALARELQSRIKISGIHFSKSKAGYRWVVRDHIPRGGEPDPQWSDVVLHFASSTSLEALSQELLGEGKGEWVIAKGYQPKEDMWQPYRSNWPAVINHHIATWAHNSVARNYASRDVTLLQKLWPAMGSPPLGDTDSELTVAVANARWQGFGLADPSSLIPEQERKMNAAPRAANAARRALAEVATEAERAVIHSTARPALEGLIRNASEPVARVSKKILEARKAEIRLRILKRLNFLYISGGSFHPDFRVIGTKSNRMSGGGEGGSGESINPQGIPHETSFRRIFTMHETGEQLDGGDFISFEVAILAAVFGDDNLTRELKSGKKFHALMAKVWLGLDYEEVLKEKNQYSKVKQADFAWMYGGQARKLAEVLDVEQEDILKANDRLEELFPQIAKERAKLQEKFCSMTQPGGLGTEVIWRDPAEYVENIFGFRRYFTLENQIVKALFKLAQNPPPSLTAYGSGDSTLVKRSNRVQTVGGATQSALYAAAFSLQAANMRAASNHPIQSTGAEITKRWQYRFWKEQPIGIAPARIRLFQIHDELLVVHDGTVDTTPIVQELLEEYRKYVPLLGVDWKLNCESWGTMK